MHDALLELVRLAVGLENSRLRVGGGGLAWAGGGFDEEEGPASPFAVLYELAWRKVGMDGRGIRGWWNERCFRGPLVLLPGEEFDGVVALMSSERRDKADRRLTSDIRLPTLWCEGAFFNSCKDAGKGYPLPRMVESTLQLAD